MANPVPKPQRLRTFFREWRQFRSLTQDQAADRLGIDQGMLSKYERGVHPYSQDVLEAMAYAYRCDPADLLMRNPLNADALWSILDNLRKATPAQREQIAAVTEALLKTGSDR